MKEGAFYVIPLVNLLFVFIPVAAVLIIFRRWALPVRTPAVATLRMTVQLILIGYALNFIFFQKHVWLTLIILGVMLCIAAWIAMRPLPQQRKELYGLALVSLIIGCLPTLIIVVAGVIRMDPWHEPRYLIPLAGMIFANAMNSLSLCADRFDAETKRGMGFVEARREAFRTALLPLLNSFFAVGLVSLPGMMTGQILSGVSPLMAVRYQIMVMCMLFGASGISSAVYLMVMEKRSMRRAGS